MPSIKQFLTLARAKIEDPKHWLKIYFATTDAGDEVGPLNPKATCFCAEGAILAATKNWEEARKVNELIYPFLPEGESIVSFNDKPETTHQDILNLFDKAIQNAFD